MKRFCAALLICLAGLASAHATPHAIVPADLWDNAGGTPRTLGGVTYYTSSDAARLLLTTSARALLVRVVADYSGVGTVPAPYQVGCRCNGVDVCAIAPMAGASVQTLTFGLPVGSNNLVEIVAGSRSAYGAGGTVYGCYLVDVDTADGAAFAVQSPPVNPPRTLFYGDSITSGSAAEVTALQSFVPLLRRAHAGANPAESYSLMRESYGYRRFFDDAPNSSAQAAFASSLASLHLSRLWMAIGTNDYTFYPWSAADFGVAYGNFLDQFHSASPGTTIYCQSPIVRAGEGTNGTYNNTLADFSAQISAAAAARSGYCVYVNGHSLMTSAGLSPDGLHPSNAGHATDAGNIRLILGF